MNEGNRDKGSFRDPSGHVYEKDGRIFRTVSAIAAPNYEFLTRTGVLTPLIDDGWLIECHEVPPATLPGLPGATRYVVEHPRLPFVSYPYEWSFSLLKSAALFHLDFQMRALDAGAMLSDASAYNVQFIGAKPIFIDLLSLRRYRPGELWLGHQQFCDQFLNPLLLRALVGVAHNAWYRGSLEGIPTQELLHLLPRWHMMSWRFLSNLVLPAHFQRKKERAGVDDLQQVRRRTLPAPALRGMLVQLRNWIDRLVPARTGPTQWSDYTATCTYDDGEREAKTRFIARFVEQAKPAMMWDIGCNTGEFSQLALGNGARYVVGFDYDQDSLDAAFARARDRQLAFLPLYLDAANPTPGQGWAGEERKGLDARANADAVLALAFIHHLAIARNVPLDQAVGWLTGLAPRGIIEFVERTDPTVMCMTALRDDIFSNYSSEAFEGELGRNARIIAKETVSSSGRTLYWFDRS